MNALFIFGQQLLSNVLWNIILSVLYNGAFMVIKIVYGIEFILGFPLNLFIFCLTTKHLPKTKDFNHKITFAYIISLFLNHR